MELETIIWIIKVQKMYVSNLKESDEHIFII